LSWRILDPVTGFGIYSIYRGDELLLANETYAPFNALYNPVTQPDSFFTYGSKNLPIRLDNIRLYDVYIPEPMTIALLGLGSLFLIRRK
jgi:hypothetical protein